MEYCLLMIYFECFGENFHLPFQTTFLYFPVIGATCFFKFVYELCIYFLFRMHVFTLPRTEEEAVALLQEKDWGYVGFGWPLITEKCLFSMDKT